MLDGKQPRHYNHVQLLSVFALSVQNYLVQKTAAFTNTNPASCSQNAEIHHPARYEGIPPLPEHMQPDATDLTNGC